MIVKTPEGKSHIEDLEDILESFRNYNMPSMCSFSVQAGKFIGFMLTKRGTMEN